MCLAQRRFSQNETRGDSCVTVATKMAGAGTLDPMMLSETNYLSEWLNPIIDPPLLTDSPA